MNCLRGCVDGEDWEETDEVNVGDVNGRDWEGTVEVNVGEEEGIWLVHR